MKNKEYFIDDNHSFEWKCNKWYTYHYVNKDMIEHMFKELEQVFIWYNKCKKWCEKNNEWN